MTTLHQHLKRREAWNRAYEQADTQLWDELEREPTESELQARAEQIMEEGDDDRW